MMIHREIDERALRPISEVTYLTTENAWRYRAILRYCYTQHERLRHFLMPDEIYEYLKLSPYFASYTEEQLQQDLNQLVNWGNLIPRQETGRVTSIEEFKRRRFRYQCTPYTVEIERMVQELENMGESFGGSLEKSLFDRLLSGLMELGRKEMDDRESASVRYAVEGLSSEEVSLLWSEVYGDFRKLTENATDYLAHLESEKVEELMRTEAFLVYKDTLTEYLRQFVKALQQTSLKIEAILAETPDRLVQVIARHAANYQQSIPRLDGELSEATWEQKVLDEWQGLKSWFLGTEGKESDLLYLQSRTNESIRRITRFVQRLGERHHVLRSRHQEYLEIAAWFASLPDMTSAHALSACIFGVTHTRHLYGDVRLSEDIDGDIWDEAPTILITRPRIRQYRFRTRVGAIVSHGEAKTDLLQNYLDQKETERKFMEGLIRQDQIILADLPTIDAHVRKTLLGWIGRCMTTTDGVSKTEGGRKIKLDLIDSNMIELCSDDGVMRMPNFRLQFLE